VFRITQERPQDVAPREALLDQAFGADRHTRTVYRLREGIDPVPALSYVALIDGKFEGSLRFWPIEVQGAQKALLLGPLAVSPERRGQAIGIALVRNGLRVARKHGHDIVLVVGDPRYYQRFGFLPAKAWNLTLPGPVDEERFQIRHLGRGKPPKAVTGPVRRAEAFARAARRQAGD
jgi:predicted N-acetyltransferase YhbS